jgi:hypothetical protein
MVFSAMPHILVIKVLLDSPFNFKDLAGAWPLNCCTEELSPRGSQSSWTILKGQSTGNTCNFIQILGIYRGKGTIFEFLKVIFAFRRSHSLLFWLIFHKTSKNS